MASVIERPAGLHFVVGSLIAPPKREIHNGGDRNGGHEDPVCRIWPVLPFAAPSIQNQATAASDASKSTRRSFQKLRATHRSRQ